MTTTRRLIRMSLVLGTITLIGLFFSAFALTDIYHNYEPNLDLEWKIVRISFLITIMFITVSLITILRIRKK